MSDLGFTTTREEILSAYMKDGGRFVATTKPYKSIQTVLFDIVDAFPAGGAPSMAHAVAGRGQELRFFSYAIGEAVTDKLTSRAFNAPGSWTNQGKSSETNGATDMVIEGISVTYRPPRFLYDTAQVNPATLGNPAVKSFYTGIGQPGSDAIPPVAVDPAALASPPQVGSPFNLEQAFASAISQAMSVSFQWDREKTDFIGTMEEMPTGSASSYLRASGEPRTDNRYKIPEGYAWRKAGQPDSTFNAVVRLEESVVIPVSLVPLFGTTAPLVLPSKIAVDVIMRLHGLNVRKPSTNG